MKLSVGLAALAWLLIGGGPAAAVEGAGAPVDPSVRTGVLPNGLRYVLAPAAPGARELSLRLVVEVGGLDEADDELGYAHLVEHMAFRGAAGFQQDPVETAFARFGVTVGRDQNAITSTDRTIYTLDLSDGAAPARALAFQWLRDVADRILFEPQAVELERGVVLAERAAGGSAGSHVAAEVALFRSPELRGTGRAVIGTSASLNAATPERLRAFHARWYRPDNVTLVIAGSIGERGRLEGEIAEVFGGWSASGPAPARPALPGPDAKGAFDVYVRADARVTPGISICRVAPAWPVGDGGARVIERKALEAVWLALLGNRLEDLSLAEPSLLQVEVNSASDQREAFPICIDASMRGGDWRPALKALRAQIARMDEPPSEDELDQALTSLRGSLLGDVSVAPAMAAPDVADGLVGTLTSGEPFLDARQRLSAFGKIFETLTPQRVPIIWRAAWQGGGPFVSVVDAQAPAREEVIAAWSAPMRQPPATPAAPTNLIWAYGAGPAGEVVRREAMASPDFVRLEFANGLTMNFRQTPFAQGVVELRIVFGQGRRGLGARTEMEGRLASDMFLRGGLGRHSYADLRSLAGDEPLRMRLDMLTGAFSLQTEAFGSRLEQHLILAMAYLGDPGFRDDAAGKAPAAVAELLRAARHDPAGALLLELQRQMRPAPPSDAELSAQLSRLSAADFAAILRDAATTGPLEVTLVGDIDEAAAVDVVARTLGAMPRRPPPPQTSAYTGFRRFPAALPSAPVRVFHAGPGDRAAVLFVWPAFTFEPQRRREEVALRLVAAILEDALRVEVRERLGKVYGPVVELNGGDGADQGYLAATVDAPPPDLPAVEAAMRQVAAKLAGGGVSEAMLESARTPILATYRRLMSDNSWLADHLSGSTADPTGLVDLVEGPRVAADLSLEEINAAAARWLGASPLVIISEPEPHR